MAKATYNNRLRVVLAERCMTNRALAEQLRVSEISVSRWVTNKAQPSMQQFIEIAKVLNIKLDDLVEPYNEEREEQAMNTKNDLFENINGLVSHLGQIYDDAVVTYTPLVDDICRRTATENEVGLMLDYLFTFAGNERMLNLYKKVCRRYWEVYPNTIAWYIMEYRKEYDPESLIGTKYEYLLHEDEDFDELESKTN